MRQFNAMPNQTYRTWEVCPAHLRIDLDKKFVTVMPNYKPIKVISGHWTATQIAEQFHLTGSAIGYIIKSKLFKVSLVYKNRNYYLQSEVEKKMKGRCYERDNGSV